MFEKIEVKIYGESHGDRVGVRICGLEGFSFDKRSVSDLLKRRSGGALGRTARKEKDEVIYSDGVIFDGDKGNIVGEIDAYIKNSDVMISSGDRTIPRPSHADFAAYAKYGKIPSGGGKFSGRMTAPLCIAGGIAQDILKNFGIYVYSYVSQIGKINCGSYKTCDGVLLESGRLEKLKYEEIPLLDGTKANEAAECLKKAQKDGDSVGGIVECIVLGARAGMLGDAMFDGLEGKIAYSVYAIPAVKGIEFGDGFDLACMTGSEGNDEWAICDGRPVTRTNRSGGINGGISNGMPIALRVAFRPTPSISKEQKSIDLKSGKETVLSVQGRNDVCIALRACPCAESAVNIALLDEVLKNKITEQEFY